MLDLHTHSTTSDGSDPPERIPELAHAAGCHAVALTDHDRLDGLDAAERRAAELGVGFVRGCEISCEVPTGAMHLLIYFVDGDGGALGEELRHLQQARDERNERMLERLSSELGLPITAEEVEEEAGGKGMGRPHVAAVLMRKGVVGSIQEAFDVYLARGKPGYVEKERLSPRDAIRIARQSGSVPVLAHPLSLGLGPNELEALIRELAGEGLAGIEAIYGRYEPADREGLADLARRHGLVATGGSDHHGTYKPDLQVGVGRGDLDVPDDVLEELAACRG
ncbi:MAG: PHP domain-containing protein [Acidimicrobiia bacterium]|nr:PHP domain-containing protein [Acidimicrobiia bacterium]